MFSFLSFNFKEKLKNLVFIKGFIILKEKT